MADDLEPDTTDDDEYDHDFEPVERCSNCEEDMDNCDCDEDDQSPYAATECAVCGNDEDDPVHGS